MIDRSLLIGDYIEAGYEAHGKFLDEDTYSTVLDSIVFACVDIAATYKGQIYLAKRTRHPQKDWWIFGGRMQTGETLTEAAHRLLRNEVGIVVSEERLRYLLSFSAAWKLRAHDPEDHGTHNVSITFTFELTDDEVAGIKLNDEYSEFKLVEFTEIIRDGSYHPVLSQCARALSAI